MKQIRDGTNDELKTKAITIFRNEPLATYDEFTKLLLNKRYTEPSEMVAQRIAETNMFATDYLELLNELMNLTERRLAKDEVIKAISEKIPPTIARQLAESFTLKAADNHI